MTSTETGKAILGAVLNIAVLGLAGFGGYKLITSKKKRGKK